MSDPVTAISNAISGLAGVAIPFIDDAISQKYENEFRERIFDWNKITVINDPASRADAVQFYILRLLSDCGQTIGSMGGTSIEVPLDAFNAFIEISATKIKNERLLANIQFKKQ